jgi:hypothetical protein
MLSFLNTLISVGCLAVILSVMVMISFMGFDNQFLFGCFVMHAVNGVFLLIREFYIK